MNIKFGLVKYWFDRNLQVIIKLINLSFVNIPFSGAGRGIFQLWGFVSNRTMTNHVMTCALEKADIAFSQMQQI